ncbi:NAD(P)-binding protein [Microthyrium microscopicum]|uniref:NAD(P)-binding protein n=1 Tax=Microthyrium microscopicum TaxID=703497 RepID=A0A6A6U3Z1_9PEZI|nr:NAD(P)-binding protein [Microthyrium microscopicum]
MTFGIAILGGGIFAKEEHLPAIKAGSDLKLVAIYSRSLKSAKSLEAGDDVDLYSDDSGAGKRLDDLLARSDVHGVVIALPILVQPEIIRKALKAGKHVLSEKPIAKDVKEAQELVDWYGKEIDSSKVTWGVAENGRFWPEFIYAADLAKSLGRLLQFQVRVHSFTGDDGKYFNTPWRKHPGYQGGFLLDGGVHYVAATRFLLGEKDNTVATASAFTAQLQEHLPPIDTLNATLKTKAGVSGTFSVSFGTTFPRENTYQLAFEKGSIVVEGASCKFRKPGSTAAEEKKFDRVSGVAAEIKEWAAGLKASKLDARQTADEALKDLILLEAMFKSGEQNGAPVTVK